MTQRYTVDHRAGPAGRDAALLDPKGRPVLPMSGTWAVTDAERRTLLFLAPDLLKTARGSAVQGLIGGLVGGALGSDDVPALYSPNAGEGAQTVKRATRPMRGVPIRWTPMATVIRQRTVPGTPAEYLVELHEPDLPRVRFAQTADTASLGGYRNGFSDPRVGVYDLVHEDGRPIVRHWAAIDGHNHLETSVFDVADEAFPLPEAVMLCMARFLAWLT